MINVWDKKMLLKHSDTKMPNVGNTTLILGLCQVFRFNIFVKKVIKIIEKS